MPFYFFPDPAEARLRGVIFALFSVLSVASPTTTTAAAAKTVAATAKKQDDPPTRISAIKHVFHHLVFVQDNLLYALNGKTVKVAPHIFVKKVQAAASAA